MARRSLLKRRAREKQASREADARALASGEISREDLGRANSLISAKNGRIDFKRSVPLK